MKYCPVCGNNHLKILFTLENIPVFVNSLAATAAQAKTVARATQRLAQCGSCGFVFNSDFEEEKVIYGEGYHTEKGHSNAVGQHFSKVLDFIESVEPLQGKGVLEVACGTGEFLQMVARRNPRYCVGVDPSAEESGCEDLTIHQTLFNREYLQQNPKKIDILINRHMIEHMKKPLEMLLLFAHALPERGLLYIETPRLDWILENHVFYDFPYEHCSYFSDLFMPRLLKAAGFSIAAMAPSFDGQFFSICAHKCGEPSAIESASEAELRSIQSGFESTERTLKDCKRNPWAILAHGGNSTVSSKMLSPTPTVYTFGVRPPKASCALTS